MGVYIGFDPGGAGAFGWCVLRGKQLPLQILGKGVSDHADGAVTAAFAITKPEDVKSAGIDAPLFWQTKGDRHADKLVRKAVVKNGCNGGTVNAVNSMRGACLVQGIMTAILLRNINPQIPITESHPKALLWLIGIAAPRIPTRAIALGNLVNLVVGNVAGACDHERDAALGAYSAFAMNTGVAGWKNLYPLEPTPISPLNPPPGYWLPIP